MPAFFSTFCVAGIGPVSMITGSEPTIICSTMRARGFSFSSFTFCSEATSTAAAPSTMPLELPAVITPPGLNAGCSATSPSMVDCGRTCSSVSNTLRSPLCVTSMGTMPFLKRPS